MKIKYTFFTLSLFFLLTIFKSAIAQNELDEKISKIEGSVDKISITADGKVYLFEGDDAKELFRKLKESSSHSFVYSISDEDSLKKKIVIINEEGDEEVIEIESKDDDVFIIKTDRDLDEVSGGIQKKVKVEVEDGNKTLTVTTKENGEEKTEVYSGKEADEYIEKMKAENKDFDISIDSKSDGKKVKKIIIETDKDVE